MISVLANSELPRQVNKYGWSMQQNLRHGFKKYIQWRNNKTKLVLKKTKTLTSTLRCVNPYKMFNYEYVGLVLDLKRVII